MARVADEFDKGDGMISAKEFMNALRFDPKKVIVSCEAMHKIFSVVLSLKQKPKGFTRNWLESRLDALAHIVSLLLMFLQKKTESNMGLISLLLNSNNPFSSDLVQR